MVDKINQNSATCGFCSQTCFSRRFLVLGFQQKIPTFQGGIDTRRRRNFVFNLRNELNIEYYATIIHYNYLRIPNNNLYMDRLTIRTGNDKEHLTWA